MPGSFPALLHFCFLVALFLLFKFRSHRFLPLSLLWSRRQVLERSLLILAFSVVHDSLFRTLNHVRLRRTMQT